LGRGERKREKERERRREKERGKMGTDLRKQSVPIFAREQR